MNLSIKHDIEKLSGTFKALSCTTRLKIIIGLIENNECNVNKMAEGLGIAQPNISQHLTILKNLGLIEGYRKGNQICYKVIDDQTRAIIQALK